MDDLVEGLMGIVIWVVIGWAVLETIAAVIGFVGFLVGFLFGGG